MPLMTIRVPDGVVFADLQLRRERSGAVRFNWAVIERLCQASALDLALFQNGPEDNVAGLIVAWYVEHRRRGGDRDPVAEALLYEVQAEDTAPLN